MNTQPYNQRPIQALILSAGQGRRLLPYTADRPKCLLNLEGRTVIERQIDTLHAAGIRSITVILGYGVDQVEQVLRRRYGAGTIDILFNPFYEVADNLASCWMARQAMREEFILLNGDTLFDLPVLQQLLASPSRPITLAIDRKSHYDDDDMKVCLEDDRLKRVDKKLPPDRVDGESIGIMYFRPDGTALFHDTLERAMRDRDSLNRWYLSVIDDVARKTHRVFTQSIEGLEWAELDYPRDLDMARQLVQSWDKDATARHG